MVLSVRAALRRTERRTRITILCPRKPLSRRAPCCRSSAGRKPPTKKRPTPSTPCTVRESATCCKTRILGGRFSGMTAGCCCVSLKSHVSVMLKKKSTPAYVITRKLCLTRGQAEKTLRRESSQPAAGSRAHHREYVVKPPFHLPPPHFPSLFSIFLRYLQRLSTSHHR